MKFLKLLLLVSFFSTINCLNLQGYKLLIEQYNKIKLDETDNKKRLANVEAKLGFIDTISDTSRYENIFSIDLRDPLAKEKSEIRDFLNTQGFTLIKLKEIREELLKEKSYLERFLKDGQKYLKPDYFKCFGATDFIADKINKARNQITKIGYLSSAAFYAYGIYDYFKNPLNHSLKDFYNSSELITNSKGILIQKLATWTGMLAIASHYIGK